MKINKNNGVYRKDFIKMDKKYLTWPVGGVIITISKITNHISNMINGGDSYDKKRESDSSHPGRRG